MNFFFYCVSHGKHDCTWPLVTKMHLPWNVWSYERFASYTGTNASIFDKLLWQRKGCINFVSTRLCGCMIWQLVKVASTCWQHLICLLLQCIRHYLRLRSFATGLVSQSNFGTPCKFIRDVYFEQCPDIKMILLLFSLQNVCAHCVHITTINVNSSAFFPAGYSIHLLAQAKYLLFLQQNTIVRSGVRLWKRHCMFLLVSQSAIRAMSSNCILDSVRKLTFHKRWQGLAWLEEP